MYRYRSSGRFRTALQCLSAHSCRSLQSSTTSSKKSIIMIFEVFVSTAIVALTAVFLSIVQKTFKSQERKRVLEFWAKAAVQRRDLKSHKCLDKCSQHSEENTFYSAKDTKSLICQGKLRATENLKNLAERCHYFGRNNSSDTGINAITEEFYDEVSGCCSSNAVSVRG